MKYWRGYLVAAILGAITLAFREIAATHTKLVDMIYPYVTRMVQNFMTGWSGAVDFCVWQVILLAVIALGLASVVLMVIFRWNPIQWFGWVVAAASLMMLLHTGIYGMNEFAGPIREDIRLEQAECTQEQMEAAASYFRDKANALSTQVSRSGKEVKLPSLKELNAQAAEGFKAQVYDQYNAVFAGSTAPVKELPFADYFTSRGEMGYTAPITGEASVNMEAPKVLIPFAICREMCYRMSIASQVDKHFGAFMVSYVNEDPLFQYAGYLMAYHYCLTSLPSSAAQAIHAKANDNVAADLESCESFLANSPEGKQIDLDAFVNKLTKKETAKPTREETDYEIAKLLVSWHQQEIILPSQVEPEVIFDPYDENMVDLTGLPHGPAPTEPPAPTEAAA